jgi:hypothetical protein
MPPDREADRGAAARDAGLRRVSRLTRWLLAGALALTATFSAIAAHAFPGRSTARPSGTSSVTSTDRDDERSGQTSSSDPGLQPSPSLPFPSGGPGNVTSGGS